MKGFGGNTDTTEIENMLKEVELKLSDSLKIRPSFHWINYEKYNEEIKTLIKSVKDIDAFASDGYENIDFNLRICGYSHKDRSARTKDCLDFVGLQKRMKHRPNEMSGGEQQRVAIARAIAHKPMLLLADEPTAELDTRTGLKMVKLFKDLVNEENITVIMCTHDTSMTEVADNIYIMEDGVITGA